MFVCENCVKGQWNGIVKSEGNCENCGEYERCKDIKSPNLKSVEDRVWDKLLALWDWHRRMADEDYSFGYADAIGQCILDLGLVYGEPHGTGVYKHEAYSRVMHDTTMEAYWKKYPKPIAPYFPAEVIRQHKGTL